jgi:hypothetical protein
MPAMPGQRTSRTPSAVRRKSLTARPLTACAAIRRCRVRSPRCTRKQSSGPGTAPTSATVVISACEAAIPLENALAWPPSSSPSARTSPARRRLDDRVPRLQPPVALGRVDQRDRDPILDRAARVQRLELGDDLWRQAARETRQAHERGVADRIEDRTVDASASGVTLLRAGHRVTVRPRWAAPAVS